MQKLADAMTAQAESYRPDVEDVARPPEVQAMQDAAKAWAVVALETFRGELLGKALAISGAMADFTAELEKNEQ